MPTNGAHLSQLGRVEAGFAGGSFRRRSEGRTVGEVIVLIKTLLAYVKTTRPPLGALVFVVRAEDLGSGLTSAVLGFADSALLTQFSPTTCLARLLVIFPFAQFFLNPAAFEQLLEAPKG
jgi:hypothetical protein